jgi:hypothetical protein
MSASPILAPCCMDSWVAQAPNNIPYSGILLLFVFFTTHKGSWLQRSHGHAVHLELHVREKCGGKWAQIWQATTSRYLSQYKVWVTFSLIKLTFLLEIESEITKYFLGPPRPPVSFAIESNQVSNLTFGTGENYRQERRNTCTICLLYFVHSIISATIYC